MKIEFKTPKQLGFVKNTNTRLVAVIYEDDDTNKMYPDYYVLGIRETKEEVLKRFIENTKRYCYVVLRNSDFTEGRGPMCLHSVFNSKVSAERYVAGKIGIFGSSQYREVHIGNNVFNDLYCSVYYNGYEIKKMEIFD